MICPLLVVRVPDGARAEAGEGYASGVQLFGMVQRFLLTPS